MFSANTSQVSNDVKYIEDFFSVYLRTGTGSSQTVTTGVKENTGALVISKSRSAATDWAWYDSFRGATYDLVSNSTAAQTTQSQGLTSFNADGHTWGTLAKVNTSGATYVDTVLKPTPKFFDVVTYTGNGSSTNVVAHALASQPAFIITKRTDTTGNWIVWHRTGTSWVVGYLNTAGSMPSAGSINSSVTATQVDIGAINAVFGENANTSGGSYIMYLFAHNAGGFGLTGTDNVISCGSFTGNGSTTGPVIDLGYEPQLLLVKNASTTADWVLYDNMRGLADTASGSARLQPNLSNAEAATTAFRLTATGFQPMSSSFVFNGSGNTMIYIAIRRGPMKVPTDGTKVFQPTVATVTTASNTIVDSGSVVAADMTWLKDITNAAAPFLEQMRLVGDGYLASGGGFANGILTTTSGYTTWDRMSGTKPYPWATGDSCITYAMKRAPSFMDVVCYSGSAVTKQQSHNLGAVPEMMIVKAISGASAYYWNIYHSALGNSSYLQLGENASPGTDAAASSTSPWTATTPTSTYFSVGPSTTTNYGPTNAGNYTYVAYLFASCPGVSKVGSYTGNGSTQTINCGFTGGARFVLIKRTDSTGNWFVWDTARGMVAGTDPRLALNSTAAETNANWVYTTTGGFQIVTTDATVNANGGSYIYLAIA